jgi:hypothetical protein
MTFPLRRAAVAGAAAGTLAVAAGCQGASYAELDFTSTEADRVTEIVIAEGPGDVLVTTGARADTTIRRTVRYRGDQPGVTYRVTGSVLNLDTSCGPDCWVSYQIQAPAGVSVRGATGSGNVEASDVAAVDLQAGSGSLTVRRASGEVKLTSRSGAVSASDVRGSAVLTSTSGGIDGRALAGPEVSAQSTSGDIDVATTAPGSVTARSGSGNLLVSVPRDRYRVQARSGSGEQQVTVPHDAGATHVLDLESTSGDVVARLG